MELVQSEVYHGSPSGLDLQLQDLSFPSQ
jgi:hypothetical protein